MHKSILEWEAEEITEEKDKEIERLHSIIKEVREYIEELSEDTEDYIGAIDRRRKVELLEILDKENKWLKELLSVY